MGREYDKLVRDEIPAVIRADGEEPITHVADDEEYERRLRAKLVEEAEEFAESGETDELADVLAVIDAYRKQTDLDRDRLEALRAEKAAERGGFDDRIVLERVEE
ncbi:nucleoside triphosphate pyrophosphohydrolase [Salinarchaeum laminariae]|uniref:nucleoside triphosphate pyrophosphohydrolase n=1 Tax=Salinarchaeum laminariae TaxID=869888 RepID=UPI0020C03CE0|nr:nucleoside triphosphate pyrophosphohydrolase [Salinarchaeum laminariae]